MSRLAVTGATGFIGGRLVARAVGRGDDVTALVRATSDTAGLRSLGARVREVDWPTGAGVAEAVAGTDCVFHLAGATSARDAQGYRQGNVQTAAVLALSLATLPVPPRLVHCSSLSAVGPSAPERRRQEDDEPAPVSLYGRSKLAGESAVRAYGARVPSVIVRPPIVYGPGDREFLPRLLPMVRRGVVPQAGSVTRLFALVHVDDLVDALLAASTRGRTVRSRLISCAEGIYHVCDGGAYAWGAITGALAHALGRSDPVVVPVPSPVVRLVASVAESAARVRGTVSVLNRDKAREARCVAWTCSSSAAERDLGFTAAFRLADGLADALRAYAR
ncbi:NAD-dependent epimerase/dehydratase family protein [Streptomyces syringium]|uniref:NAD-dependent epimerase/dehydratase family protein n=1 Tax=Streptomyces syringium TaxID=76729 RepID=UPI0034485022